MRKGERVLIFDTTLRDGQQCPGAGISFERNIEYAHLAHAVGVDVLEAGFPAASTADFEIVKTISEELSNASDSPKIAALCQQRKEQVERTIEAIQPAIPFGKARLHIYLPVAPALMAASLGEKALDKRGLVEELYALCKLGHDSGCEVEFSPEGYSRQGENFSFTTDLLRAAADAGATIFNCPDTIGSGCWLQGEEYFVAQMKRHAEILAREFPKRTFIWSTHCHNDFGLALHNSLAAVFDGPCRQIEGCFNGIGERAGNVPLEQCIMAIKHFAHHKDPDAPLYTGVKLDKLQALSNFVAEWMLPRQPHWPITGNNAARHSAGGHTNAILSDPLAYQPFDPREHGNEISFAFGPLSGGNHAQSIIEEAGFVCTDDEKAEIAQFIKDYYSTRRKGVTDSEVVAAYLEYRKPIEISHFEYSKKANQSEVLLRGKFFAESGTIHDTCEGRESALATLKKAIDRRFPGLQIIKYNSESVGGGISAKSRSSITISRSENEESFHGMGEDDDIEVSAMKALIDGTNKAYVFATFRRNEV